AKTALASAIWSGPGAAVSTETRMAGGGSVSAAGDGQAGAEADHDQAAGPADQLHPAGRPAEPGPGRPGGHRRRDAQRLRQRPAVPTPAARPSCSERLMTNITFGPGITIRAKESANASRCPVGIICRA